MFCPDGVRPTVLAESLSIIKQAIPLINDLERWGYLSCEADPSDGRGRVLRLTPRGKGLLTRIRQLHAEIEDELRARLGPAHFNELKGTLAELSDWRV